MKFFLLKGYRYMLLLFLAILCIGLNAGPLLAASVKKAFLLNDDTGTNTSAKVNRFFGEESIYQKKVNGVVTNNSGAPIPGVTV